MANPIMRVRRGKTDAARRDIPISPRVLDLLRARWEAAGKLEQGWVWPNKETKSGHIEPSTIKEDAREGVQRSEGDAVCIPRRPAHITHSSGLLWMRCLDPCSDRRPPEDSDVHDLRPLPIHGRGGLVGSVVGRQERRQ
jgi:integrase